MNCKQMTQHLHEWVDGELREPTREQVKEHLEACPDCSKHVKAIGHLKHLVQVKTVRPPVPAGLEARIRESIAAEALTERQPRILRRPPRARLLWAAALLLFILPALLFFWPNPRDVHAEIAEHNFHSHLDSVTGVDGTPRFSCDGRAMAQKILREELGLSVILPIFPGARVRYEGVSFEDYGYCTGAKLHCTLDGKPLSLFVIPDRSLRRGEEVCCCMSKAAYNVMCARIGDLCISMVTSMSAAEFSDGLAKPAVEIAREELLESSR